MHPYTIDTGVRKKVIIYIFIFSIVLSSVLTYFLEAGILSTKHGYSNSFGLIKYWKYAIL